MKLVWSWIVSLSLLFRYPFYRLGIGTRPLFTDHWAQVEYCFRQVTRMNSRIRVRHLERCPKQHPAIYAGNHTKLDDPFYVCHAVQLASNFAMHTRFVMRDDFFDGFPWCWMPFRMNEIAEMGGSYNISQKSSSLAQLRPLVGLLLEPDSFVIFPGGGRSMSGFWIETHLGDEPGSIAFFLAQAQRKAPELPVPAVPVGRTFNPVKKVSAVILGVPRCLEAGARRDAQRAFDDALMFDLSELVEIHALHLVCGLLYLRCRHAQPEEVAVETLIGQIRAVLPALADRYLDPALPADLEKDVDGALRYLARFGMIQRAGTRIRIQRDAILRVPASTPRFRYENPVQFHLNQIIHLADVAGALEQVD